MDRFTSAHAGVGVTMAALGLPWWAALGMTIGWELVENFFKDQKPHLFPYSSHDSIDNSIADTAAVIVGFVTTRHMMRRGLTPAGKAALHAAVGSTFGAFVGSGTLGLLGKLRYGERDDRARGTSPVVTWGGGGYILGCAVGGAVGGGYGSAVPFEEPAAFGGAVGGAAFGPLGAALGTYLAVGVAEERAA
jgi:hypothetical protein